MNRPAYQAILERQKDGKYIVALDTDDFHKLDTIPLTQAHVDTIRQMLIEGEVYKNSISSRYPLSAASWLN